MKGLPREFFIAPLLTCGWLFQVCLIVDRTKSGSGHEGEGSGDVRKQRKLRSGTPTSATSGPSQVGMASQDKTSLAGSVRMYSYVLYTVHTQVQPRIMKYLYFVGVFCLFS